MPYTGTYYVKVSTYAVTDSFGIVHNSDVGNYELFMYSFAATTCPGHAVRERRYACRQLGARHADRQLGE